MVKLVALVGHRYCVDDLAKSARAGFYVDHRERVGLREVRAEQQRVGEVLSRGFHRKLRGCVEGRIRPHRHWSSSLFLLQGACLLLKVAYLSRSAATIAR